MRRKLLLAIGVVAVLALTGCTTTPRATAPQDDVAMGQFDTITTSRAPVDGVYFLGAGDELGEAVFTTYVAWLLDQDGPVYATGNDPRPDAQ